MIHTDNKRQQIIGLKNEIKELSYTNITLAYQEKQRRDVIKEQAIAIEKLQLQIDEMNKKLPRVEFANETLRNQANNKDNIIKRLKAEILKSEERWKKQAKKPFTMSNKTIVDYLRQLLDRDLSEYEE